MSQPRPRPEPRPAPRSAKEIEPEAAAETFTDQLGQEVEITIPASYVAPPGFKLDAVDFERVLLGKSKDGNKVFSVPTRIMASFVRIVDDVTVIPAGQRETFGAK